MLLPPKIIGPINESSTAIAVVGALNGASVQLFANGLPLASPVVAGGLSVSVPLGGSLLTPGAKISATQSLGGETSIASPFPETVNAAPSAAIGLPAVVFLSALHPCADWVLMGGLVPGATVQVLHKGARVGEATASGSVASVPISFAQAPAQGDMLTGLQTFKPAQGATIKGPGAPSPPVQASLVREPPPPAVQPPYVCDMAVLVSGLLQGSSLVVNQGGAELAGYPFVGTPVWAELIKPIAAADLLQVRQDFRQCRAQGLLSAPPVGPIAALKLPPAAILGPICPNAAILRLRNLRPGATVVVWVEKVMSGSTSGSLIGQAQAWAPDCDFALPPGWSNGLQQLNTPGQLQIKVWQENCGKSSDPVTLPVNPLPGAVGQPAAGAPVECARIVAATGLTAGAYVVVTSDQADWPQIAGPVFVTAGAMPIGLNRPLRAHEHIVVKQDGCNAAASSPSTEVAALTDVPPPVVETPVRIPHGGVGLRNLIVGARVHVFLNGALATSLDATGTEMFVPVAGLGRESQVWARQVICTKISDESRHEVATLGRMKITYTPSVITRTKPTSLTVTAVDADDGRPVNGNVTIGAAIVGATGAAFAFTFAPGAAPASAVNAADYQSEPIAWNLVDPPPVAPAMLHLAVVNQAAAYYTIASVNWSIERQELNGSFTLVAAPTGQSVAVHPPTNGQYHVYAAVGVADLVNGGTVVAEFRGTAVVNGLSTLVIVWSGADLSHTFRLTAETQTVFAGGGAYTIINPVVVS